MKSNEQENLGNQNEEGLQEEIDQILRKKNLQNKVLKELIERLNEASSENSKEINQTK